MPHDLLEVLRGRRTSPRSLADAAVGLLDQASSSASAASRSPRWASSSSTWRTASSYSCSASGLTGPSCSRRRASRSTFASSPRAPRRAAAPPRAPPPARAVRDLRAARATSAAESRACCAAPRRRHRFARALEPRLDLGLLVGAGAQLGGRLLAGRRARVELLGERVAAGLDGLERRPERRAARSASAPARASRLDAGPERVERARSAPRARARPARPAGARRGGPRGSRRAGRASALVAALSRARLDQPLGAAQGLVGLVELARGAPRARTSASSRAVSAAVTACPRARPRPGRRPPRRRRLGRRDELLRRPSSSSIRSLPPAGRLRSSPVEPNRSAAARGDGDAAEVPDTAPGRRRARRRRAGARPAPRPAARCARAREPAGARRRACPAGRPWVRRRRGRSPPASPSPSSSFSPSSRSSTTRGRRRGAERRRERPSSKPVSAFRPSTSAGSPPGAAPAPRTAC